MWPCSCEIEHSGTPPYPLQHFFPNHYQFSRRRKLHLNQHKDYKRDCIFLLLKDSNFLYWQVFCVPVLLTGFPSKRKFKPIPHLSSNLWEFWICQVWVWSLTWNPTPVPDYLPEQTLTFFWALKDLFLTLIRKRFSPSLYFHKLWVVKSLWHAVEWQWSIL